MGASLLDLLGFALDSESLEKGQQFMLFLVNINIKNEKKGYCYCCLRKETN